MKLKTSFFKPVTLKKDILRFTPVWVLYFIGVILIMMELGSTTTYDRFARNFMPGCVGAFAVVNLCYGGLCANLLFGDLYNTKLCYSLHAMPYRRESWLATHLLAGLLFSLVPNCLVSLYLMFKLEAYWFLALYWLLSSTLQFMFFYGLAAVSALLTGNRFAMLLVYAGFNFVAMLLYATVEVIYIPMLQGVVTNFESFSRFSPAVQLFTYQYFNFTTVRSGNVVDIYGNSRNFYRFDGLADGWGYMAILACVGLAAMAVCFWLYRRRQLESAGDFVAFARLKGLACVIMTVCVTLCFALAGKLFDGMLLWLVVGLFIGFFGSLMLLERRLKVFRKGTFLGFCAMGLAVAISVLAIYCDWFGIETWTPSADRVVSVTVANSPSDRYYNYLEVTLEDEDDIAQIITAHEDILTRLHYSNTNSYTVYLTYKMKSGRTVSRYYVVPTSGEGYEIVRRFLYNTDAVLGFKDAAATAPNVNYMHCSNGQIPAGLYEKVLRTLQTDCARGLVALDYIVTEYYLEFDFVNSAGDHIYRTLYIHPNSETAGLLKGPEIAMGYTDWDAFLASVEALGVDGENMNGKVPAAEWEGLLTALRKDIEQGNIEWGKYIAGSTVLYYELRYTDGGYDYREFHLTEKAKNTMTWLTEKGYIPKESNS